LNESERCRTLKQNSEAEIRRIGIKGEPRVAMKLRIDTPIEIDYYRHGGILPFVLRQLLAKQ
jgi:aconitate hydratase